MTRTTGPTDQMIDAAEADRRVIEPNDFVADKSAFIDVRLPGSAGKSSYSFIGPGVSQNADQTINLAEPHGFNIGAASLPNGVINNPHLHYTAEVFICTRGRFEMRVGQFGEQTVDIEAGTVFSVPTWVFRGFRNIGPDDGWLFTVLGDDDTGGILWAPQILEAAKETGLHLSSDYSVIDTTTGEQPDDVIAPVDEERLKELDSYTDAELLDHIVTKNQLAWSDRALLSSLTPGHEVAVAPVIGHGITEDRRQRAPITNHHGFSLDWIRLAPGSSVGLHRVDEHQVLLLESDSWQITYNSGQDEIAKTPALGSVVSLPAGCWRNATNVGDEEALALVVTNGDGPARIEWHDDLVDSASRAGWARDASGYLAPADLLARPPAAP